MIITKNVNKIMEKIHRKRSSVTKVQKPTKTDDKPSYKRRFRFSVNYRDEFPRLIRIKIPSREGKITGKRAPGRQRENWFDDMSEWTGHTYSKLKNMAQ
ncbi:jg5531 [Pararge aegeria aegeria]|uniref:Jg5531 protein n=1 Tax=Pararge aegeria aegeria TaxID=348720 RepID=A0A8S4SLW7_9NEOP|nr:jg5531 [Pararge aegeria aegeria]